MSHQVDEPDVPIATGVSHAALAEQLMALAEQWAKEAEAEHQARRWHEAYAMHVDAGRLRQCAEMICRRARDGRTA